MCKIIKLMQVASVACMLMLGLLCGPAHAVIVMDFEDLPDDIRYRAGDVFITSGVSVQVQPFQLLGGSWTNNGNTYKYNMGAAGGSGYELFIGNVNLVLTQANLTHVSLLFAETGGNFNLSINGDFRNLTNLPALNGTTIGGVCVIVVSEPYYGHYRGLLEFDGPISSFLIGGQELVIDNVSLVPEPASLLALCAGLIPLAFRRRRR